MKNLFILLFLTINISVYGQNVRVAAAADLRYALDEIINEFVRTQPKAKIDAVYGSSGNAYNQILNGAPYDIYFSADVAYPQKLSEQGYTLTAPRLYGIGRIVLWSSSLDVTRGLSVLTEKQNIKIAIANPAHAPYGDRTVEALKHYKLYDKLKSQFIYGENVSQASQFCLSGNADAGFLALSIVLSPSVSNKGKWYIIDSASHKPLEQAYVVLRHAKGNKEAFAFAEFVNSAKSKGILEKYGFSLPKSNDQQAGR